MVWAFSLFSPSKPIIFSFFAGSGFLDLGFEKSGFDVRFVNEFHKPFLDAYKYSREHMELPKPKYGHHLGSIDDFVSGEKKQLLHDLVQAAKSEALTGFIGGPPCPDFSVAGKNRGSDGDNGVLTRVYVDSIVQNQPDFFLFENVKGLWRTVKHRAFYEEMKTKLNDAGYVLTDRLTNSIEFGVPQDRDRILMFGVHRKHVGEQLTSEQLTDDFHWEREVKFDKSKVLDKAIWPALNDYKENSIRKFPKSLEDYRELTVEHWFKKNDVYKHINAKHHFKPYSDKFKTIREGDDGKKSFKRLHRFRYSPTAAYGNNEVHLHPYRSRRLSAAEALAIQSLPKEFHLPPTMTLSDMFKTIGNGVPYLTSLGLAKTIRTYLLSL
ncbi:DNA cytosine methyltransferase [Vibrio alginolyticus]|nr:DNA cytosine methyltransferase [Vibrio parahaemolyticus]EHV9720175.1 DNA cytosine methyltransferase [Vibrio parahaemolyticus]EID7698069.1 DNA cytosine methyltransferase [Vibrio parahaemolyticus]EIU6781262.1 DNA cytosine methyltransferase [Vibrio parahaemolyticus]EJG1426096.1 DNA cytosine methyltransferase [Vibrio parahaemolyticus]MBE4455698.1 DNA cytosine methyltransferase [Vibrio parahaemolyticus]